MTDSSSSSIVRRTFIEACCSLRFQRLKKYWYFDLNKTRLYLHLIKYTFGMVYDLDSGLDFVEFTPSYPFRTDLDECGLSAPLGSFCDRSISVTERLAAYDEDGQLSNERRQLIILSDIKGAVRYYDNFTEGLTTVTPDRVWLPTDRGTGVSLVRHLSAGSYGVTSLAIGIDLTRKSFPILTDGPCNSFQGNQ